MPEPQAALRRYVTAVRRWLRGEGSATHIPQRPAAYPVPVYVAALASPAVELGGELADGIMPFLWSAERVTKSRVWADRGRAKAPDLAPLDLTLGLPRLPLI
jgi:alkanesulfonate monooxygenase SsuD/methylene tetrahydromethanopterin reductase-like flavin-dependent oxidoreductase (luciferase family)